MRAEEKFNSIIRQQRDCEKAFSSVFSYRVKPDFLRIYSLFIPCVHFSTVAAVLCLFDK